MQLPPNFCGIYYPSNNPSTLHTCLPLVHLDVYAKIVDVSAVVTLTQQFWQYSSTAVQQAKYAFPVPSQAAVCGFEMRTQDGRVVKAVAKEKEQARREHHAAIQQGRMTGLVEHITEDIFSMSLGALPASQIITTTVTYVLDLMDADLTDQVRFQLPVCIGMRYGVLPDGMPNPSTNPHCVSIVADVAMKGPIKSITSPTHDISLSGSSTRYQSTSFLNQDFVLVIKADGLNEPRCFAERHPSGTVAIQLTMVPKFDTPPIPAQEYIFVIDRSGSMSGMRIETAKKTLVMLLRGLPSKGTTFNIVSFGSRHDSMFLESVPYTESTLAQATNDIDQMSANYGGTEIRSALHTVFNNRSLSVPTACFVLTDGKVLDIDNTLQVVSQAVAAADAAAPLRVFTLGIGETVSTAMCEGIARVGNGVCLMAATAESIIAKSAKLVRASRTHFLTNTTIEWGTDFTVSSDVTSQTQFLRQAPLNVPPLYAGNRFVVFVLLKHKEFVVPEKITVRARLQGTEVTFTVAVDELVRPSDSSQPHLIHTLAARKLIQDLDDADRGVGVKSDITKSTIIHLGEQYQLASRYTSFIAVDTSGVIVEPIAPVENRVSSADIRFASSGDSRGRQAMARSASPRASYAGVGGTTASARFFDSAPAALLSFASPAEFSVPMQQMQMVGQALPQFTTRGKTTGSSRHPVAGSSLPTIDRERDRSDDASNSMAPPPPMRPVRAGDVDATVLNIIRLQSFDGSFQPTAALEQIVGLNTLAKAQELGVDRTVWATALAVAYLQKHLVDQPEVLAGLLEKAREFASQPGVDFEELLDAARLLVI